MQGTSDFSRIVTAKTLGSVVYAQPHSPNHHGSSGLNSFHHHGLSTMDEEDKSLEHLDNVSSDSAVSTDTLYMVMGSVLGGLTVLVVLLVALYQCRQKTPQRSIITSLAYNE